MASVHPCKHANVLKDSTANIAQNKGVDQVGPHLAILIFIKFFNSIMPNIDIDCDFDFEGWVIWGVNFLKYAYIIKPKS